jgi:AraC family transcriptional regulator of adaptative response / DNA-3-methyladenine glycosylase II
MTYSAVVTTGIYCRPGCGARPRADNVRTFEVAAAAEAAGFRACLRCRPYRVSGTIPWQAPEFVCRAIQLIIAGALDDGTEAELGAQLGMSARHLRRLFHEHLGLTPDQFARSRRAHFARRLLDDTELGIADIAFAAGFGSLRQFNRIMREVFRAAPQQLRERRRRTDRLVADGGLVLRLPVTPPYDWNATLDFLGARAIPGVEDVAAEAYRRTVYLDGDPGLIEIRPGHGDHLLLCAHLPHWEGLIHVVERVGRLLALDLDLTSATEQLGTDPIIGPLIAARPGLRVPGSWSPFEVGVHAVIRQHRDDADTRALLGRIVQLYGTPIPGLPHGLTHAFPTAETVAAADLDAAGLPPTIARTIRTFAGIVAAGDLRLDGTISLDPLIAAITAIPGIGSTTAHQLALRLGERDASPTAEPDPATEPWRPWRSLAAVHLLAQREDDALSVAAVD